MKQSIVLALMAAGTLAGSGCSREPRTPARTSAGKVGSASQVSGRPEAADGSEEAYILSQERLDNYIQYQKALIGIYDGLLKDLENLPAKGGGSRAASAANANGAMRVLESKARAEEKARSDAHLSERDTRQIEQMVMAVLHKRGMARSFDPSAAIKQWESMRDALPADQRADLDRSIGELKQQQEEAMRLTEERRQFGDANVDLILSREDELTRGYEAYVNRLTGHR
jgi:hypothetical protein